MFSRRCISFSAALDTYSSNTCLYIMHKRKHITLNDLRLYAKIVRGIYEFDNAYFLAATLRCLELFKLGAKELLQCVNGGIEMPS